MHVFRCSFGKLNNGYKQFKIQFNRPIILIAHRLHAFQKTFFLDRQFENFSSSINSLVMLKNVHVFSKIRCQATQTFIYVVVEANKHKSGLSCWHSRPVGVSNYPEHKKMCFPDYKNI